MNLPLNGISLICQKFEILRIFIAKSAPEVHFYYWIGCYKNKYKKNGNIRYYYEYRTEAKRP